MKPLKTYTFLIRPQLSSKSFVLAGKAPDFCSLAIYYFRAARTYPVEPFPPKAFRAKLTLG
jgi:hypothetical protein